MSKYEKAVMLFAEITGRTVDCVMQFHHEDVVALMKEM